MSILYRHKKYKHIFTLITKNNIILTYLLNYKKDKNRHSTESIKCVQKIGKLQGQNRYTKAYKIQYS